MPRFPISVQRTAAPNAFSSSPRARPADFGAGLGEAVAEFGVGAARLGRVIGQRQEREAAEEARAVRQAEREAARVRLEATRDRLERAAGDDSPQATPVPDGPQGEPQGDPQGDPLAREQARFESRASGTVARYAGDPRQPRVAEALAAEGLAWNERLIREEGQRRLGRDLETAEAIVGLWSGRVAQDPACFEAALAELLGAADGEAGLMAGLGLRPEALSAWKSRTLERLLEAQLTGDPERLLADLEAGRWQDRLPEERHEALLEDVRDALALRQRQAAAERGQQAAGEALSLSQLLARGEAGVAEIRRAERAGRLTPEQAAGLKRQAQQAGIAAQAEQAADDELALSLSGGLGFDAGNPQNRAAAERFYEARTSAAVRAGADPATRAEIAAAVAKTGYLPKALARDVTGLLASDDETRQAAGAALYGRLLETAPELLEPALDPETRARGGVLSRWLAAGLSPAEARARVEEELKFLDDDDLGLLQRDLSALFFGDEPGRHVSRLIDLLERNYLTDLGRGLTSRAARARLQNDVGRVMRKLGLMRSKLEAELPNQGTAEPGTSQSNPLLHSVSSGAIPSPFPFPLFLPQIDQDLAAAGAIELEGGARGFADRLGQAYGEVNEELARLRARISPPYAAYVFRHALLSIGDGAEYLGNIREENERTGIRTVDIQHPDYGRVTIRQQYDITAERYRNLDATFWDREKRDWVTEKLPSNRFTLPPETDRRGTPPLEPQSDQGFEPGGFGEQGVPDLPPTTGGPPADHGPMSDPNGGFAPAEDQGPTVTVSPDQSDEFRLPILLESIGSAEERYKGKEARILIEVAKDIGIQTGISIQKKQFRILKNLLRRKSFWKKISSEENNRRRAEFDKARNRLIALWEKRTKQEWPLEEVVFTEDGVQKTKKVRYQAHHLIPISLGGPWLAWWNIHPARFPDQHQGGIHRSGGPTDKLMK